MKTYMVGMVIQRKHDKPIYELQSWLLKFLRPFMDIRTLEIREGAPKRLTYEMEGVL